MASAGFVRLQHFILRILQFCASAIILGIFSYFLAVLADHDLHIVTWAAAVEGISGAATLYSLIASIFITLSSKAFFAALAMLFDFLFGAAFIAIAIMARDGTQDCSGNVKTPLGEGDADGNSPGFGDQGFGVGDGQQVTYMPNLGLACRLQTAAFAVSIIGIFLFFVSIFMQRVYAQSRRASQGSAVNKLSLGGPKDRRPGWKFWRKQRPTSPYVATSGYYQEPGSVGSIPLSKQPSSESNPPRYTGVFGWNKDNEAGVKEPQTAVPSSNINSPRTGQVDSGPNYGYRSGYRNDRGLSEPSFSNPFYANDYGNYNYGPSGLDGVDSAHGYGDSPYDTKF